MEKKNYMAPQMKQVVLITLQMLSTSVGIGDDKVKAEQSFANDRDNRDWGDIW